MIKRLDNILPNIALSEQEQEILKTFRREWKFVAGAIHASQLPTFLVAPEIAFIGKSNVGKSSLINLLTGRKALARMSHTPGRTRQINFFSVNNELTFVDLPGYGYAKISKVEQNKWEHLILSYLSDSPNLKVICLLIDARRGIKEHDLQVMAILKRLQRPFFLTFTKIDKVTDVELQNLVEQSKAQLQNFDDTFIDFLFTSSRRKDDTQKLRISLGTYLRT
ncbi:MAG: YihA family ribosome biosis GTP-binding protein [Rickettsiaceae bacterium]|jgi:GTP-binding protein|nr:YihA family ribosome biosis GTP-binding protein [Rickettsiaceae bacterium]